MATTQAADMKRKWIEKMLNKMQPNVTFDKDLSLQDCFDQIEVIKMNDSEMHMKRFMKMNTYVSQAFLQLPHHKKNTSALETKISEMEKRRTELQLELSRLELEIEQSKKEVSEFSIIDIEKEVCFEISLFLIIFTNVYIRKPRF